MSRFNLLDEPWISVIYDEKGSTKDVSLQDLFTNITNVGGLVATCVP